MFNTNHIDRSDRNWTTQKLISLSHDLGRAYYPGLNNTETGSSKDTWTTARLIQMSRSLSSAYGIDF